MVNYSKNSNSFIIKLFIPLLFFINTGCDGSIDPLVEETGTYSIYGYIDVNREVNFIRVSNLKIPLVKGSAQSIDGTVTLQNLETGTTQTLQDSIITFNDVVTHNFKTTLNILPETTYQIKVERSDGKFLSAKATTPNIANYSAEPINQKCRIPITITFEPVNPNTFIVLNIRFRLSGTYTNVEALFPEQVQNFNGKLSFTFLPGQLIYRTVCGTQGFACLPQPPCHLLDDDYFTVEYTHYGPDTKVEITDSLSIPGGAGTFIGLLKDSFRIPIDTSKVE